MARIGCPPGDNADADLYRELQSAIAALSEPEAQPSAPTVEKIMQGILPHIEMRGGPIAYKDRCENIRRTLNSILNP
jgi:hypothetical protein